MATREQLLHPSPSYYLPSRSPLDSLFGQPERSSQFSHCCNPVQPKRNARRHFLCNQYRIRHKWRTLGVVRGGLERWKRGVESHGVRQAINYALKGTCDSHHRMPAGVGAAAAYSGDLGITRFSVRDGRILEDELDTQGLARWVDGCDPVTGERRGRDLKSPNADLLLDGTINAPKTYSIAALVNPDLAAAFEALQDRLRTQIIRTWQRELNARRGAGGRVREAIRQIEVVELQHRRSRALDPHIHRHLWLNVKVEGQDGAWSNVDSRVAMKLHTVINAEGELAARTDPEWIATLAAHGLSVNADGEIAQLAHLVRPLSRRSNQIEANRARFLAEWQDAHPGEHPSHDVLSRLDRRAWAESRPNKPGALSEDAWEQEILDELRDLDRDITCPRMPVPVSAIAVEEVDVELLAAIAIVDADDRSTSTGGRFSRFDLRAGAMRAVARSGVVARRRTLDELIARVEERALLSVVDLLPDERERPAHVKSYMASDTLRLKMRLTGRLDALATPGTRIPREHVNAITARLSTTLASAQIDGVAAVAGTDVLVTVVGPAGAGKTTMLRVALAELTMQRRRMIVVAPTRKAADVVSRETGASATSIHSLLADHGYRWTTTATGATEWSRLSPGDVDPATGRLFDGPQRHRIDAGDRIVVDEAGMVDLHAANALAELTLETGAGLALVGDPMQALPVGHSGAMATAVRRATATVELDTVHRFEDPAYAELTLRLRNPDSRDDAQATARELHDRGHVKRVDSVDAARREIVDGYFTSAAGGRRVAIVTGSNADAEAINDAIQQRRIDAGDLDPRNVTLGMGEQRILIGDIVQTRRNDNASGVQNRATWIVRGAGPEHVDLVSANDASDIRRITSEYAAEHLQLAYASTVHGIQGETTDDSIVGPDVDASGLYVGLTRGRRHNTAITIAPTDEAAIDAIAAAMNRGVAELTIDDSVRAAREELCRAAAPVTGTPAGRSFAQL